MEGWKHLELTRLPSSSITPCEITTLDHKVLNNAVEGRALISKILLPSRESAEVLSRLRDSLAIKAHHNASKGLIAMRDIEVDLMGDLWALHSASRLSEEEEGGRKDK